MRALLVARVSSSGDRQDPDTQMDSLRDVARRLQWSVAGELVDRRSAWSDKDADVFERTVLERVAQGGVDVVAVWAMDRLTRRGGAKATAIIARLEKHFGVQFYSLQEPFLSTATADPNTRDLLMGIFGWLAQQESQRRSNRLKAKAASRRARAESVGQRGRWGRGRMPTSQDRTAIHQQAADKTIPAAERTIRAIAEQTGFSVGTVHKVLQEPCSNPTCSHRACSTGEAALCSSGGRRTAVAGGESA